MASIRTASELGLAIRARRKELTLSQIGLAERVGVTRQWVIDIEKGKPRAEFELVLRTIRALDLNMSIEKPSQVNYAADYAQALRTSSHQRCSDPTRPIQRQVDAIDSGDFQTCGRGGKISK